VSARRGSALIVVALALSACATPDRAGDPFSHGTEPLCSEQNETMILIAQSVQSATRLPCIAGYPAGWSFLDKDVRRGSSTYSLSSSVVGGGVQAVEVQLLPSCDAEGEPFTDERAVGADAYLGTTAAGETRTYLFDGGCVVERIFVPEGTDPELLRQARSTLGFVSREHLAATLEQDHDVILCGAGAEPCEG
jgi:hypothetical protein